MTTGKQRPARTRARTERKSAATTATDKATTPETVALGARSAAPGPDLAHTRPDVAATVGPPPVIAKMIAKSRETGPQPDVTVGTAVINGIGETAAGLGRPPGVSATSGTRPADQRSSPAVSRVVDY